MWLGRCRPKSQNGDLDHQRGIGCHQLHASIEFGRRDYVLARFIAGDHERSGVRGFVEPKGAYARTGGQVALIESAGGELGVVDSRVEAVRCRKLGRDRVSCASDYHAADVAVSDGFLPDIL